MATNLEPLRNWHILWAPSGFGNNTAKLVQLLNVVRKDDAESDMYYPTYMDRLRDREVMVPLFPNYAFIKCRWYIDLEDRMRDEVGVFVHFLKPVGALDPHVMTEVELDRIKASLTKRVDTVREWLHVGDLAVGDRVIIKNYKLTGQILYFMPPNRVMVQTVMFKQEQAIPVKLADLERL